MKIVAFAVAAVAAGALWIGLGVTISDLDLTLWPAGDRPWLLVLNWGLVGVFDVATIVVVATSWNTWLLPRTPFILGTALVGIVGGSGIAVLAAARLNEWTAAGMEGPLVTTGPYSRSRHPQYVGMAAALGGAIVIANSATATALLVANIGWLGLRAIAEEQYLATAYPSTYRDYSDRVPRFIGRQSIGSGG